MLVKKLGVDALLPLLCRLVSVSLFNQIIMFTVTRIIAV